MARCNLFYLCLLFFFLFLNICKASSIKRGFVASGCKDTGLGVCSDDRLLPGLQYYSYKPTNDFPNPLEPNLFTPMVWCSSTLETPVPAYVTRPYVMIGFNEADSSSQCGITPLVAAQRYGILMSLNPPPNQLTSPSCASGDLTWYDNFFRECARLYPSSPKCGISIMNTHYYVCNVDSLMRHLNKIHDAYGMPIYLTEWACNLPQQNMSVPLQMEYMRQAVEILESTDWVLKYYWFRAHIPANNGLIDINRGGLEVIADLGSYYLSLPYAESTPSPSPSPAPTLSPSSSVTATPSRSDSPSSTLTATFTDTLPTNSKTASKTRTPSRTPTRSISESRTQSPSKSPTRSFSKTPSPTSTSSISRTPSRSPTKTPSSTKSPTKTPSSTKSPTKTPSSTRTPSKSPSSTRTLSTPTRTPSSTSSRRRRRNRTL